ncbi:MAG: hypothetical protein C0402_07735 [Thermodesulfovibrio sp.]|nr:hypothetical protein [Thermodesulfovibrio sp.]
MLKKSRGLPAAQKKPKHQTLRWILEPLLDQPDYLERPMFGCLAAYLHGRLVLVLASGEEPWNGILIPTEREFHPAIQGEFSAAAEHPVLKKWLYLSESLEDFESVAADIVEAVLRNDPRFGVEPGARSSRKKKS